MQDYEKLGAFYLGKLYDQAEGEVREDLLLYDAKDLTTHGVCVGMTGSGKTGLCLSLLEEAAIDNIPTIAIDPKGDLGNLLLTFPKLRPEDFEPWIDPAEAARKGSEPKAYAEKIAKLWKNGLASWGQQPERIARFRESVDIPIYTPGSSAGLPLMILKSFNAPPPELIDDQDAFLERISATVSGLLALLGIDADPIRSREHIFLSNVLQRAWSEGRDLDISQLIREIQAPPFERIGVLDLESFFPQKERFELSMALNNLLASPSFAQWMEGEPLDIERLLWTPEGKPRLSILSISHLSESERMFFVTLLLNEIVAWIRTQAGTSSLRAILYMDEIFGYFPPTANPPSKKPMLTLLKQARAFGLGCLLATQNPVDLDYKGLSNTGTWFLGRLQTERDKLRVLEGLEGASTAAGSTFNRQAMEATLAGLGSRVFLMNNVHEDQPALFHTRWAMSYLRGPLTRTQIRKLMEPRKKALRAPPPKGRVTTHATAEPLRESKQKKTPSQAERPLVPPDVPEFFLTPTSFLADSESLLYRPALLGTARLHWVRASMDIDEWKTVSLLSPIDDDNVHDPWSNASEIAEEPGLAGEGEDAASFDDLPSEATKARSYSKWSKALVQHLYRTRAMPYWTSAKPKAKSKPGETEGEFRRRVREMMHEKRDLEIEKLRERYAPKLRRLEERIRTAEHKVDKESEQYEQVRADSTVSWGATIIGALFGRKLGSRGNVSRASTAARRSSRMSKEKSDIRRAKEKLEDLQDQLGELEREFEDELHRLEYDRNAMEPELTEKELAPRKSDISVTQSVLVWTPWKRNGTGKAEPLF